MTDQHQICRLNESHAAAIVDCFYRVYGASYAEPLFYDAALVAERMSAGSLCSVGAINPAGVIDAHMAMMFPNASGTPELGNTVVDQGARGGGLAWQVGDALTRWCLELGHDGFLHYPTTQHHIMQRQSVEKGFEVGLMLSYIPAETDAGVSAKSTHGLRQAATIVYQPLQPQRELDCHLPTANAERVTELAAQVGAPRCFQTPSGAITAAATRYRVQRYEKRSLARFCCDLVGADVDRQLQSFIQYSVSCWQVDFNLGDAGVDSGISAARDLGFCFCGWLPGFAGHDVLRMQRFVEPVTELQPDLSNPGAETLIAGITLERAGF